MDDYILGDSTMILEQSFSIYTIYLQGELESHAFSEVEDRCCHIVLDHKTILFAIIHDQSELHGILKRIRDIGIEIISLEQGIAQ